MKHFREMLTRRPDDESGAAPPPEAQEAASAPVADEAPAEGGEAEAPVAKPPQGLLDRIGQLTRQKRELEERLAQVAAYQQPQAPEGNEGLDPRVVQLEIQRQAQEIARNQSWKETTDRVWSEGLNKYGDWAPQLNNMAQLLGGIPQTLTEAAIETGTPHEVLYHLAKNPDEAARIVMLPPMKQAVAIAKLAQTMNAPKRVSSAPPPVTPKVQGIGSAVASLDDPNISMEEWARLRNEQIKSRRKGR